MNRRTALAGMGAALLAACGRSNPLDVCTSDDAKVLLPRPRVRANMQAGAAATVRGTQDFMEALRAGITSIELAAPVDLTPLGRVWLDEYVPHNHFALYGAGGYTGAQLTGDLGARLFGSDGKERHWEFHFHGITVQRGCLDFEVVQQSVFEDVRWEDCERPFMFGAGGWSSNVDFIRPRLLENSGPAMLLNAQQFAWSGGAIEDHAEGRERAGGLVIRGMPRGQVNSYPGPGIIHNVRQEFTDINVHGIDDLHVNDGYHFFSRISLTDCGGRLVLPSSGSWPYSGIYRDGSKVFPVGCNATQRT